MKKSRHFTTVDDWVTLNPEISNTEFRVYAIIKGKVKHGYGGIPETGLQPTASWVSMMSRGRLSVVTAHRALRGLAEKGVLRRLNNPKAGSAGVKYEFVVDPGEEYTGPLSVMTYATEMEKNAPQGVSFSTKVELSGHPSNGKPSLPATPPSIGLQMDGPDEDEPEFDMSALDSMPAQPDSNVADLTMAQQEFAAELERVTSRKAEEHLRLMEGQCVRIAKAVHPALERGWDPGKLAHRMAAELNPKIHSPEKLLLGKSRDLGAPPKAASGQESGLVLVHGQMVDLSAPDPNYDFSSLGEPKAEVRTDTVDPETETKAERLARIARKYGRN